ncbi:cytoplasmic protein [Klebsiella aerogenes]|uniref:cytoplasmic protein n=1 Tax=Klebsiella aerogenes TaxID=548 RepID=UPI0019049CE3|nr:cytoplasmic protein [Klebsiella aerogenes]MBK0469805.1 cytoplasmic protein [Klebsiella aerogenes]HBU8525001.1 cytoplasmic protein [Klebsiella aerogenes]
MQVAEHLILATLQQGGCMKTFYRIPAWQASTSAVRIPSGYVLETPGASCDTPLSHADFSVLEKSLMQVDCWEQVVGRECFGGTTWQLCPDT